jgi:aldehyde:ferredoxin oxidoreductase
MGTLARVDLSSGSIRYEPFEPYADWMGGRSLGALLAARHPGLTSTDPRQQPIVLAAGPLVGSGFPMGTRASVTARNQLSGGMCYSSVGGEFATRLRTAGFEAVLIEGWSERPVYLLVEPGRISIQPAEAVWGQPVSALRDWIKATWHPRPASMIGIGPAGEREVPVACLMVDEAHAAGWGGSGAVFGAKRLKAVVAVGGQALPVADPAGWSRQIAAVQARVSQSEAMGLLARGGTHGMAAAGGYSGLVPNAVRNLQDEYLPPEQAAPIREDAYRPWETGRAGCPGCSIRCLHRYAIPSERFGPMAGEGMHANSVRGLGTNLSVTDREALFAAHRLCNEYGLDVDGVASAIAFAFECAERGILDVVQAGGLRLAWGDGAAVVELTRQMGERTGLGALLGQGSARAAATIGQGAGVSALTVKGVGINEQGLRTHRAWALGVATATRGAGHLGGAPQTENRRISAADGERLAGSPFAGVPGEYAGKGRLAARTEALKAVIDSLGLCYFVYGWYDLSLGSPNELAEWYRLATGQSLSADELLWRGLRCHHLERALNHRLAGFDRKDDRLPDRFFDTPVSGGAFAGEHLDRGRFETLLDEYYAALGWDVATGIPGEELLTAFGLSNLLG